jgi:hypothetical protein
MREFEIWGKLKARKFRENPSIYEPEIGQYCRTLLAALDSSIVKNRYFPKEMSDSDIKRSAEITPKYRILEISRTKRGKRARALILEPDYKMRLHAIKSIFRLYGKY